MPFETENPYLYKSLRGLISASEVVDIPYDPHSTWDLLRWLQLRLYQFEKEHSFKFDVLGTFKFNNENYKYSEISDAAKLKECIKQQQEIILSAYIQYERQSDRSSPATTCLNIAFEKFKNRLLTEVLYNFEIVALEERMMHMGGGEIKKITQDDKDLQYLSIQLKRFHLDMTQKLLPNTEDISLETINEVLNDKEAEQSTLDEDERGCFVNGVKLASYQEVYNSECAIFTTCYSYIKESTDIADELFTKADNFLKENPQQATVFKSLSIASDDSLTLDTDNLNQSRQGTSSLFSTINLHTPMPSPKHQQNCLLEFALAHPGLTAGIVGLLVAVIVVVILTSFGASFGVALGVGFFAGLGSGMLTSKYMANHENIGRSASPNFH